MHWMAWLLTIVLLGIIAYDVTRYRIPNWLVAILLVLYPIHLLTAAAPVPWPGAMATFTAMFALGYLAFFFRLMGGGDVKLLAVLGLWAGSAASLDFIIYTAVIGGILSLLLLLGRPVAAWAEGKFFGKDIPRRVPRILILGEPVPYGLAIAGAFLAVLWMGKIPGLPVT